jgi:hypothetical protein
MDPDDRVLLTGKNERQGDYIFTANKVYATALRYGATADKQIGEYSFCFENEGSSADKLLDFDIMVESEPRRQLSAQQPALKEHTSTLEESTYKLSGLLSSVIRTQK